MEEDSKDFDEGTRGATVLEGCSILYVLIMLGLLVWGCLALVATLIRV